VLIVINMKDILIIVIPSIISAFTGWFIGFRKQNIDLCSDRLDELEKSIKVYNIIIDDLAKKVEELTLHIIKLEATIDSLKKENKDLKKYNGL
jgi:uncharacterized coiled-coil protein SlyX